MQALHYLIEQGDSYRRIGKLNLALKKYYAIQKVSSWFVLQSGMEVDSLQVFESFREDQYEFHQYSVRKAILNVYAESESYSMGSA